MAVARATTSIGPATVFVWRLALDLPPAQLAPLEDSLSPDERARAARFRVAAAARRFVAARGQVRQVLAHLLQCAPAALRFEYNAYGKPGLAGAGQPGALSFNVSHSAGIGLLAVGTALPLGIDIEQFNPRADHDAIARHFFAAGEVAAYSSLPAGERAAAFYRCWTRKEAVIKAHGAGLSLPLASFDVTLLPADLPRLVRAEGFDPSAWRLFDIAVPAGFAAALAVAGAVTRVTEAGEWSPAS
jgi:4'-phosphopantetheinyl transferase